MDNQSTLIQKNQDQNTISDIETLISFRVQLKQGINFVKRNHLQTKCWIENIEKELLSSIPAEVLSQPLSEVSLNIDIDQLLQNPQGALEFIEYIRQQEMQKENLVQKNVQTGYQSPPKQVEKKQAINTGQKSQSQQKIQVQRRIPLKDTPSNKKEKIQIKHMRRS